MKVKHISRRAFIQSSVAFLLLLNSCKGSLAKDTISFKNIFGENSTEIRDLGRLYLNKNREFNAKAVSLRLEELAKSKNIEILIKEDFLNEHTIEIEGWIFSKTEMEISALYSLSF